MYSGVGILIANKLMAQPGGSLYANIVCGAIRGKDSSGASDLDRYASRKHDEKIQIADKIPNWNRRYRFYWSSTLCRLYPK